MTKTPSTKRKPPFADPRDRPGFDPARFPQAQGRAAPAIGAPDPIDRIKIQFLSVYYELNLACADLLEVRAAKRGTERNPAEQRVLRRIERALRQRDAIEDQYAPIGIIAEPVMQAGFAVDVRFTFGTVNHQGRPRSEGFRMSAYRALPRIPGDRPDGGTGMGQDGKADSDELSSAG